MIFGLIGTIDIWGFGTTSCPPYWKYDGRRWDCESNIDGALQSCTNFDHLILCDNGAVFLGEGKGCSGNCPRGQALMKIEHYVCGPIDNTMFDHWQCRPLDQVIKNASNCIPSNGKGNYTFNKQDWKFFYYSWCDFETIFQGQGKGCKACPADKILTKIETHQCGPFDRNGNPLPAGQDGYIAIFEHWSCKKPSIFDIGRPIH